jgi:hypothetical protein
MFRTILRLFKPQRRPRPQTEASHYNLQQIYAAVNMEYFENKLDLQIRWFGSRHFVPRTRIRLGSYNQRTQVVKIHRFLDKPSVPLYFISYIVYHEMLHHVLPPIRGRRGRRQVHHRAYSAREKEFHQYGEAKEFSKNLLEKLRLQVSLKSR